MLSIEETNSPQSNDSNCFLLDTYILETGKFYLQLNDELSHLGQMCVDWCTILVVGWDITLCWLREVRDGLGDSMSAVREALLFAIKFDLDTRKLILQSTTKKDFAT